MIVLLVVASVGGYWGYQQYQQQTLLASIAPHAKSVSLRLNNSIELATSGVGKVTYADFLGRLTSEAREIDQRILDLQVMRTSDNAATIDPVLSFAMASKEVLEAFHAMHRHRLQFSIAVDGLIRALRERDASTVSMRDYYQNELEKAETEANGKRLEADAAERRLALAATVFARSHAAIAAVVGIENVAPVGPVITLGASAAGK